MSIAKSKILKGDLVAFADSYIMVPLDIQGSTIAMPIDIQGQTVTIDVNITNATINVNVTNSTLNVEVQGTANIYITGQGTAVYPPESWSVKVGTDVTITNISIEISPSEGVNEVSGTYDLTTVGALTYIDGVSLSCSGYFAEIEATFYKVSGAQVVPISTRMSICYSNPSKEMKFSIPRKVESGWTIRISYKVIGIFLLNPVSLLVGIEGRT